MPRIYRSSIRVLPWLAWTYFAAFTKAAMNQGPS
jgi:hypothetical protein